VKIFLTVVLLSLFFLIIFLYYDDVDGKYAQSVDCGLDAKCFADNFALCIPSKVNNGLITVLSGKPNSCKISVVSPESKIDGQVIFKEMSMICITNSSYPTSSFEIIKMNNFDFFISELIDMANCKGDLADFYIEENMALQQQLGDDFIDDDFVENISSVENLTI